MDFPSPTVVTMPNHASTSMCHPYELRALTLGECAAIQEFPVNWKFYGKTTDKYRQVGNAVPVRLGEVAGKCIADLLDRIAEIEPGLVPSTCHAVPSGIEYIRSHVRTKRYWYHGKAMAGDSDYYGVDDERTFAADVEDESQFALQFSA